MARRKRRRVSSTLKRGSRSRARNRRVGRRYRRRAHNRRRYSRRGRRFNPAGIVGSLTSGFNIGTLKTAGVLVTGGIANSVLSGQLMRIVPVDFLKSGMGSYVTRLLSAGLLGGIVRMVAPNYAGAILTGAVTQVGLKAVTEFSDGKYGISGLSDYLTLAQVQQARPLAGLGDYLTSTQVAQARPLMTGMGYGDDWLQGAADSFDDGAF